VTRKITKGVASIKKAIDSNNFIEAIKLGNLESKRDWSDAEDFVHGIWLMLNQEKPKDYVLSSDETHTVREFVELSFAAAGIEGQWLGKRGTIEEVFINKDSRLPMVMIDPKFFRPAEVELLLGDSTMARSELRWQPKTSFFQLVKKMTLNDLAQ
jgi:GDPmannose 4,6-dehydratase